MPLLLGKMTKGSANHKFPGCLVQPSFIRFVLIMIGSKLSEQVTTIFLPFRGCLLSTLQHSFFDKRDSTQQPADVIRKPWIFLLVPPNITPNAKHPQVPALPPL